MRRKFIVMVLLILLITSSFIFKHTFAISDMTKYNFYIKENKAYGDNGGKHTILTGNGSMKQTKEMKTILWLVSLGK